MPVEFGPPADELSQGDLLDVTPLLYVRDLRYMERIDADRFRLVDEPPPNAPVRDEHAGNAVEVRRRALVLTHDCEIDKDTRTASVIVVAVRPLAGVPQEHWGGFREGTRHRAFHLPSGEYLAEESYADLRAVTTIRRSVIDDLSREASINEEGRNLLQAQLFRFFARRILPADWVEWQEED